MLNLGRVEDLWFPDANLILRAENTLFRVHSSILCARCSVFRDMVAFPQPDNPESDTIDGNPVVRLHDLAGEVEVFLRAVFDSSFFMPPPSPTDFDTVIGIMRLAHKYDAQYLFRRALSHLESMYPTDLPAFLEVHHGREDHHIDFPSGIGTDLSALRAASEVSALWLLPAVYYSICIYPSSNFFTAGEVWKNLGVHEQQTCLKSQVEFVRGTGRAHQFLAFLPHACCTNRTGCEDLVDEARDNLSAWSTNSHDLDPLGYWVFSNMVGDLCGECCSSGKEEHDAAQLRFWNRMPEIVGLPKWEELKDMRRAVMEEGP